MTLTTVQTWRSFFALLCCLLFRVRGYCISYQPVVRSLHNNIGPAKYYTMLPLLHNSRCLYHYNRSLCCGISISRSPQNRTILHREQQGRQLVHTVVVTDYVLLTTDCQQCQQCCVYWTHTARRKLLLSAGLNISVFWSLWFFIFLFKF